MRFLYKNSWPGSVLWREAPSPIPPGWRRYWTACVSIFKIEPGTGERLGLIATATVGEDGWVDLAEPIIVRAGEAFAAVPDQAG